MIQIISVYFIFAAFWMGCTIKHQIEPSDKPFQVNLNVKIDHEVRVKIAQQNKDFLNLEEEYLKKQQKQNKAPKTELKKTDSPAKPSEKG